MMGLRGCYLYYNKFLERVNLFFQNSEKIMELGDSLSVQPVKEAAL